MTAAFAAHTALGKSNVTSLILSGCSQLTDDGVVAILGIGTQVTCLDLTSTSITDAAIAAVCEKFLKLESFMIGGMIKASVCVCVRKSTLVYF